MHRRGWCLTFIWVNVRNKSSEYLSKHFIFICIVFGQRCCHGLKLSLIQCLSFLDKQYFHPVSWMTGRYQCRNTALVLLTTYQCLTPYLTVLYFNLSESIPLGEKKSTKYRQACGSILSGTHKIVFSAMLQRVCALNGSVMFLQ